MTRRKWLHRVARAYGQSPDQVRGWEFSDYLDAAQELAETPLVDEAVFMGFFKPREAPVKLDIGSRSARKAAAATLRRRRANGPQGQHRDQR